jgi:SHAQKYF class myb-like DNA-binding protein
MSMSPSSQSQSGKAAKRRERWTEDEHARFMDGLNRYGRKWKKIQACVKTKTAVQVRTHAYGYFAKLLRNMPEDDAAWELAEEMSSLPGAVLKGPASGKRRSEPKTDEAGMEVLRRFVFCRKKSDSATTRSEDADMETASVSSIQSLLTEDPGRGPPQAHHARWESSEQWNSDEASTDAAASDLKRQRLH